LQLVLGVLALLIGTVHLKDFFALHRGFSLSIPDAVKPGLYQRIRAVVRADNLPAALAGVIVIAVLVNFVELLCTAGLPALYTQVLSYYPLDTAGYYGYLLLYNLAYIADDTVMVAIAVATLGQRKLQEREGRWLKLLSAVAILVLGALLVFAPQLLTF
jgi:Na+-translocating ferredoxin:NAD+ oxidoreductase RnfA subunit